MKKINRKTQQINPLFLKYFKTLGVNIIELTQAVKGGSVIEEDLGGS